MQCSAFWRATKEDWTNVLDFGEDDQETTYIDDIMVEDHQEHNMKGIFSLNGQRLDAPQKGINIINGKKVFMKWE